MRILLAVTACAGTLSTALAEEPVQMKWDVDGTERLALVFTPRAKAESGKMPLVFAFHGHGSGMKQAARTMDLQKVWPEALVVYPEGQPIETKVDPEGRKPGWQRDPGELGDRDLKFFDAMLATLHKKYPVDRERTYATGFSNGGFFSYLLWAERPDLFAAFGSCAGRDRDEVHLKVPKPVVQISGEKDKVNPFADQIKTIEWVRKLNGCTAQGRPWEGGSTLYASTKGAPVATLIHSGGHVYPPGASELIVAFFKQHALAQRASSQQENDVGTAERTDPSAGHTQSDAAKAFRKTAMPVTFPSNGRELHGWLYKPEGDGPFPAVLWNHGSEKDPGAHPDLGMFYTSHGYVLFLPVRHGHGQSPGAYIGDELKAFAEKVKDKALVKDEAVKLHELYNEDVVAAVAWLKDQPFVDRKRIAVTGLSYGGIQTLLTAEKGLGVRAFVPFAPGAMSWANTALQKREVEAVERAKAPLFLLQSRSDYSIGPSEVLGPVIRKKGGLNRAKLYPPFGTTHAEGHGGFACWEEGIAIWGHDVLDFLTAAGMGG